MNIIGLILMVLVPQAAPDVETIMLPQADQAGSVPLERCIAQRRSAREFAETPLTDEHIGQLLWAAQGISGGAGRLRTAPSAGALYPLKTYVVQPAGIYRYSPENHTLSRTVTGDKRNALRKAALDQDAISSAPVVLVFSGVYQRSTPRYRDRAVQYVHIEAGHACQNVLLQATALGLEGVPIGAFDDRRVSDVLGLSAQERPLYLIPVGHPVN